jgi:hypothetical protein
LNGGWCEGWLCKAVRTIELSASFKIFADEFSSLLAIQLAFNLGTTVADFVDGVFYRRLEDILSACLIANFAFLAASEASAILLAAFSKFLHC